MNQMNLEKPLKIKAIHFPKISQHLLNEIQMILNFTYIQMNIRTNIHTVTPFKRNGDNGTFIE